MLQIDQKCLEAWLLDSNHSIVAHLQSLRLTIPMLASQWVLCAFINTLPHSAVERLWDVFLLDGSPFLFAAVRSNRTAYLLPCLPACLPACLHACLTD